MTEVCPTQGRGAESTRLQAAFVSETFPTTVSTRSTHKLPGVLRPGWLCVLFFLSGFPALLYQVVWQRALFTIYGVNIESVTVVVSAFMLGLGLGSLVGGFISQRHGMPLLAIFGMAELGIGAFGVLSLSLFQHVGEYTAGGSALRTGTMTFALLLIPTVSMGGTLPILTAYLVRISGNVGRSVGVLYCVNTLGSAAACFCCALFTMRYLGQSGSVKLAAGINAVIGSLILTLYYCSRETPITSDVSSSSRGDRQVCQPEAQAHLFPLTTAIFVSGLAGFVALGNEILWYRLYSFMSAGQARAFALLLGFYLTGIALGALLANILCHQINRKALSRHLRILAAFIFVANLFGYLVIPVASQIARLHGYLYALPLVMLATILLGGAFPLISHITVKPDSRAGTHVSFLYLSNIIGSTLGSFVIGYILMDIWTIKTIAVFITVAGLVLGTAILLGSKMTRRAVIATWAISAGLVTMVVFSSRPLFDGVYERLQERRTYIPGYRYKYLVETKSGVITVTAEGMVFGGGIYDGVFNTDIIHDRNGAFRPYSLSLWHHAPRKVLMIGIGSGSWAQIVANHPQVERLTIVEINPGYLKLIPLYEAISSVMNNPKVEILIDDGRRWLVRNPNASYDVILMNTTYHWRAHASNLLSIEFLQLVRRHLERGGVLFYNTTGSGEAQITGATVFPYALMVGNCLAVSDSPISLDWARWKRTLIEYRIDGKPVFNLENPGDLKRLAELSSLPANQPDKFESVEYAENIRARNKEKRLITDDNMGTEWPPVRLPW